MDFFSSFVLCFSLIDWYLNSPQPADDHQIAVTDFAQRRLQLGETLYFKVLEKILINESKIKGATVDVKNIDFSVWNELAAILY